MTSRGPSRRGLLVGLATLPVAGTSVAAASLDDEPEETASGEDHSDRGRPVAYMSESGERWSFDRVGYGRLRGDLVTEHLGGGRLYFRGEVWQPVYEG